MKYLSFILITLFSLQAFASTCQTNYRIVDECYETRGRLQAAKERPRVQIWKVGTKRILGVEGKVVGLETIDCSSVFDKDGNFNPQVVPETESIIEADSVIVAIGQEVDFTLLKAGDGVLVTKGGLLQVDGVTQQTNVPGIFAAGDAVEGPGLVITAIAKGHEAATSIDRYLQGEDMKKGV